MSEITITGYVPGAIGRLIELHGVYYSKHWALDVYFETVVAREIANFMLDFDPAHSGFWTAVHEDRVVGSIIIDGRKGHDEGARLRFFILDETLRGRGVGKQLMQAAMDFCKEKGYSKCWLTTFAGLDAARALYEKWGFVLVDEHHDTSWGRSLPEQTFVLDLTEAADDQT